MQQKKMLLFLWVMGLVIQTNLMSQNTGIGHNVPEGMLDLNGDLVLRSAKITLPNGTSIAVDVESNPFSNYSIMGPTAAFSIGGISASPDGKLLSFFNSSGQLMTVLNDNAGNVGIGTQFPGYKLSVAGNGYFSGTNPNVALEPAQGSNYMNAAGLQIASPNTENYPVGIETNMLAINGNQIQAFVRDINDGTSSDYVRSFSINHMGGNVGIGTLSPAAGAKMTIETADFSTALQLRNKSNSVRFDAFLGGAANGNTVSLCTPGAMPIAFYTNAANRMMIAANGNIGIGTDQPDAKLQVNGNTKLNGNLHLPIRVINSAGTFDINEGDLNIVVDVPYDFQGAVRINLPTALNNTGRILNITGLSLPVKTFEENQLVNKQAIVQIRPFENGNTLPILKRSFSEYSTNKFRSWIEITSMMLQSDGYKWHIINLGGFENTDFY